MSTITRDTLKERLDQLDLDPIKVKLVHEYGYGAEQLAVLEKWYKRFLCLTALYPEKQIVIPEVLDAFWHHHILDTRKYADDCEAVFGQFLHHFPYFGLRGEEDMQALHKAYRDTLETMRLEWGETPEDELATLGGPTDADAEVPSLCSDCSGYWDGGGSMEARRRPRLADIFHV